MDALPAAVLPSTAQAVAARGAPPRADLERLHPALWRAHRFGAGAGRALTSGFAVLDAQLPGGGWPRRVLTELLLAHPGVGEMRLLAPSLAATLHAGRLVMLFDPPATLSAWALAQLGLDAGQMLVVDGRSAFTGEAGMHARPAGDSLWALEQALRSGHVGALLAWLPPRLRAERLRRLQLAAQAHDGPAFMLRETAARGHPSAAPLRLALEPAGADRLALHLFKRRGPPLAAPLQLVLPPVLSAAAQRKARARAAASQAPRDEPLRAAAFVDLAASPAPWGDADSDAADGASRGA
ncbi:MAG: translesion DNA synthesis-associated protein ImuA [Burkholderiaceae bacterium]|nr:translesion DNA synthesis-associated protein ImuA [Burkholderiaceae bacterium]